MNSRMLLRTGATAARVPMMLNRTTAPQGAMRLLQQQQQQLRWSTSDAMGEELIKERQHQRDHAGKSSELWRKLSFYGALPLCLVMAVYIYQIESEHLHHRDHEIEENDGELPETTKYDYNDIRKKPYPWAGDGKDNTLFFNPKANRSVSL